MDTRAKDSDRNNTCKVLDSALSEGQLTMEEHRDRISLATSASTLGDLQDLVVDLQVENAPVQMPELKKPSRLKVSIPQTDVSWGVRVGALVAACLLGIGIGWGLYGNSSSPFDFTTDPGAKPDGVEPVVLTAPTQLLSLGGLVGLFEQMRQRFGDTQGYGLTVYAERAYLDRADANDPRRSVNYSYQGGWGDPSEGTTSDGDRVVDLAAFDMKAVVAVLKAAPQTLGLEPSEIRADSTTVSIDPSRDFTLPDDTLVIAISITDEFGSSGRIELNPDGTQKYISLPS